MVSNTDIIGTYNGKIDLVRNLTISPFSRAYTFSDSIYEVIPFYNRNFFYFDKHFTRLSNSLNALAIEINLQKVKDELYELLKHVTYQNGYIYYQISRGTDPIRNHIQVDGLEAETFGYILEHDYKTQELNIKIVDDLRWGRCDIKSTSLLANVMGMNEAKKENCQEIIMHRDGLITEAGASNIFFVIDGIICTPALGNNILPGITREILIELVRSEGMEIREDKFLIDDLLKSQSVWLTSSTKCIAPVRKIVNLDLNLDLNEPIMNRCIAILEKEFKSNSINL